MMTSYSAFAFEIGIVGMDLIRLSKLTEGTVGKLIHLDGEFFLHFLHNLEIVMGNVSLLLRIAGEAVKLVDFKIMDHQ